MANDHHDRASSRSPRAPNPGRGQPTRAHGRELAVLALCHLESYRQPEQTEAEALFWSHVPSEPGDAGAEIRTWLADVSTVAFAQRLVRLWLAHAEAVDVAIETTSRSWRLSRMDRVDRNILRLVAIELQHHDTPRPVVLAEAVRLASRYGSERSAPFVNGIAEALGRKLRPPAPDAASEP